MPKGLLGDGRRSTGLVVAAMAVLAAVLAGSLMGGLAAVPAAAAELRIGQEAQVTSVDPHHENYGPNLVLAAHVFDRLIHQDETQQLTPGLAVAWEATGPTEWRFDLRPGVTFHDGSAFESGDVLASWRRAKRMGGPSSLSLYTVGIADMTADGPLAVRVTTTAPYPLLPVELSQLPIIPSEVETATPADFASGAAAIGTGPFRFVSWTPETGEVRLAGNPHWWGGPVVWDKVTMRSIPDDVERLTAVISGRVDMIAGVPPADVARLEATDTVRVVSTPTVRVIYLGFDVRDRVPPDTRAIDGRRLTANPFQDPRVREAVSIAIDREAIVREVMEGQAVPAPQLVPDYLFGASSAIGPIPHAPERGRALLAEAGYPDGFRTRLVCTRDRYVNDAEICDTVARMLGGIGVNVAVTTLRSGDFFGNAAEAGYPLRIAGWGTGTGEASYTLKGLLGTRDVERGIGVSNFGGYSNPALDAAVAEATAVFDDGERRHRLAAAMDLAMADRGVVPLHFQKALWAVRRDLRFTPTNDEFTLALDAAPRAEAP
jgi:peptide/nickel transport system substrate-binding protein